MEKSVRQMALTIAEASIYERMERVRGFNHLNQEEHLYLVSKSTLDLHPHDRLHYTGTNRRNAIFPVSLPSWTSENVWRLSVKVKHGVIGKNARILVGGPAPFGEGNRAMKSARGD